MHKVAKFMALLSSFVLMLAVCSFAANSSNSKESANKAANVVSTKSSAAMGQTTARSSSDKSMHYVLAPAEDLNGTIGFIAPSDIEVTLIGANGTPYDFRVTPTTKIELAGRRVSEMQLSGDDHKLATVRFLPTSRGNLAERLEITG
jgi:hypothetical protein